MSPFDIKRILDSAVILIDTREQDTAEFRKRVKLFGLPVERQKLNAGDYSIKAENIDLSHVVAIERKMSADELAACFTHDRERFKREFERAREANTKIYLLVENTNWENINAGKYRSKFNPKAYIASLTAWLCRYNCTLIFCKSETTPMLIREILYRELKEKLERGDENA